MKLSAQGGIRFDCKRREITLHMLMQSGPNFICLNYKLAGTPFNQLDVEHNVLGFLWYWEYGIEDYQQKRFAKQ